jgi:hypothetical protein
MIKKTHKKVDNNEKVKRIQSEPISITKQHYIEEKNWKKKKPQLTCKLHNHRYKIGIIS